MVLMDIVTQRYLNKKVAEQVSDGCVLLNDVDYGTAQIFNEFESEV